MEEQRSLIPFVQRDELHATAVGRALWQTVRRKRRGRAAYGEAGPVGPYETTYAIANGYPDGDSTKR